MFGMFLNGALAQRRDHGSRPATGPAGFIAEMERAIQPRDQTQRDSLRPYFTQRDSANRAIVDGARHSMEIGMDSLRRAIAPMLDDAQRRRLSEMGAPNGGRGRGDSGRGPPGLEYERGGRGRNGEPSRGGPPPRGSPPPVRPPPNDPLM